jgi:ATP-dependent helicase HrpA
MIGHTQPRRIAASSVAKRIAEELNTPLGEVVGYKVRFQDRLSRDASVKLMTDGILLAETQTDPLLKAYDTIIIDEAHERSLNIDFLLGYLRQILPRRPDLKVVVTSATIDADRFAKHFARAGGPGAGDHGVGPHLPGGAALAPVRGKPRLRPERGHCRWRGRAVARQCAGGDILVFLPGEREIREAADHLRKHLSHTAADAQCRGAAAVCAPVARPSRTASLTATRPAHRAGHQRGRDLAHGAGHPLCDRRRHGARQALQLPQQGGAAAGRAHQPGGGQPARRALRARGQRHLHPPVRREGLQRPPALHRPEILRSSLAGVILRMKSLHLGDVEQFPFIEAPSGRAIADGYQLLGELGAVDDANELTPMGRELSACRWTRAWAA